MSKRTHARKDYRDEDVKKKDVLQAQKQTGEVITSPDLVCVVCLKNTGELDESILICDHPSCYAGYHLKCLKLKKTPKGAKWHCPTCTLWEKRAKNERDIIIDHYRDQWPVPKKDINRTQRTPCITHRIVGIQYTLFSPDSLMYTNEYKGFKEPLSAVEREQFHTFVQMRMKVLETYYRLPAFQNLIIYLREIEDFLFVFQKRNYAIEQSLDLVKCLTYILDKLKVRYNDNDMWRRRKDLCLAANKLIEYQGFPIRPCHENVDLKVIRADVSIRAKQYKRSNPGDIASNHNRMINRRLNEDEQKALEENILKGKVDCRKRDKRKRKGKGKRKRTEMDQAQEEETDTPTSIMKRSLSALRKDAKIMQLRFFNNFSMTTGRRGIDYRSLTYSAFCVHEIKTIGPVPCIALCAPLTTLKEKAECFLLGCVRSKEVLSCPIGAMAMMVAWMFDCGYMTHIFDLMKEDLDRLEEAKQRNPDAEHVSKWWKYSVLFSPGQPAKEMSASHLRNIIKDAMYASDLVRIIVRQHLGRNQGPSTLMEAGFIQDASNGKFGWDHGASYDRYFQNCVQTDQTLQLAGFPNAHRGNLRYRYTQWRQCLPEDLKELPFEFHGLVDHIFPHLDELYNRASQLMQKYPSHSDWSAVEFLKTLLFFRRVILEDSAVLYDAYHETYPFLRDHPIFHGSLKPTWKLFQTYALTKMEEHRRKWDAYMLTIPIQQIIIGEDRGSDVEFLSRMKALPMPSSSLQVEQLREVEGVPMAEYPFIPKLDGTVGFGHHAKSFPLDTRDNETNKIAKIVEVDEDEYKDKDEDDDKNKEKGEEKPKAKRQKLDQPNDQLIPMLPLDIVSIPMLYQAWTSTLVYNKSIQAYCKERWNNGKKRISWAKAYPHKNEKELKNYNTHFNKVKPLLLYLDHCMTLETNGHWNSRVLAQMDKVCAQFRSVVDMSSFIKSCFYYIFHKSTAKEAPKVSPDAICEALKKHHLPNPLILHCDA